MNCWVGSLGSPHTSTGAPVVFSIEAKLGTGTCFWLDYIGFALGFGGVISLFRRSMWDWNSKTYQLGGDLCWHLVQLGILDVEVLVKICGHLVN